jgi:DNA-binding response OmpR family regulator
MSYSTIGNPVSINALGRLPLLIVNTDPLTRELYTHALNLEGYHVETAGDGADALEWHEMEEFPAAHQSSSLEENGLNSVREIFLERPQRIWT